MGLFLMLSGVADSTTSEVEAALRGYAAESAGTMSGAVAGVAIPEDELMTITESDAGHVTVMYPPPFAEWDEASAYLSEKLQKPVLSLHIHDSDLWMYVFFVNGEQADCFNPIPDYWFDESEDVFKAWAGDAEALAQHWPGLRAENVANYLKRWTDEDLETNPQAYPDDKYGAGEEWQLGDFMEKVNLDYPVDFEGSRVGTNYRFHVES